MLVTTATANKLIADVWFARADFAKDNPTSSRASSAASSTRWQELKAQDAKQRVAKLMAAGYSIPGGDALGMLGDAHWTNYAENREFFLNQNNPTNFERTWNTAYFLYKTIGAVTQQTPFDQVMDFSIIQKLGSEAEVRQPEGRVRDPVRAGQRLARFRARATRSSPRRWSSTSSPTRWDLHKKVTRTVDGKDVEELYDPNVELRGRGDRQAGRPVRRGAHHHRGAHRRLDARHRCRRAWSRSCRSTAPTR